MKLNKKKIELSDEGVEREIVAKFAEEHLLQDQKSIDRMVQENPTLMQRIKNIIDDLAVRFKGKAQEKELRNIQKMYDNAFKESKNIENKNANAEYSIIGIKGAKRLQCKSRYSNIIENYKLAKQLIKQGYNV